MRLLFTGGGTGGHVYPALAVIARLRHKVGAGECELTWAGRPNSIEQELVARERIAYWPISTGALRGRSPWQALTSLWNLVRGVHQSLGYMRRARPDAVFSTGGYVTVPVMLAAWLLRVPAMIYLPDMEPGMAVRLLAKVARRVCVSFDSVAHYFATRKVRVTGYPVREALFQAESASARARLGLAAESKVVLVLGGSSGAHSINVAMSQHLQELVELAELVHVTGPADQDAMTARGESLGGDLRGRYHVYGYLHEELTDALAAADLVIARAGASTLAEFPAAGLPAILVPYPYAGEHQRVNAEYLASRGGAVIVPDAEMGERLAPVVRELLTDAARLDAMAAAMRAMSVPDAADRLAQELLEIAGEAK